VKLTASQYFMFALKYLLPIIEKEAELLETDTGYVES
jgi:hypothetical protein